MSYFKGQAVIFGRTHGEQTQGVVEKVNPKSIKIRQTEARGGHPVGTIWTVAPNLVRPANGVAAPTAPTAVPVKDGMDWNRNCAACGLKPEDFGSVITLQGTQFRLVGLNPRCPKNDVEIERVRDGKKFKCSSDAVRRAQRPVAPVGKRTEDQILSDIVGCYAGLSPENLFMDGEISHSQGMRRAVGIRSRMRDLFQVLVR
jgi:hypothetical protein